MNFKVLGVCGGNGLILHPFRDHLLGNIEVRGVFRTPDDIQWRLNFPHVPLDLKNTAMYSKAMVNVIIGAPDCGHSSMLSFSRAKKLGDPNENYSLKVFLESIQIYQPEFFLMENLPKLLENWKGENMFPGYKCRFYTKPVTVWGNSQASRVRLVAIGIRSDVRVKRSYFELPQFVEIKTVDELRANLHFPDPSLCHVREPDDMYVPLYYGDKRKITIGEAKRIWQTEFKGLKKWVVNQGNLKNQPGIYRNIGDELPLTVRKQNRQFNPDGTIITPREVARIQGVPDNFKLWYSPERHQYSINKARVTLAKSPPYEIGKWFYNLLIRL